MAYYAGGFQEHLLDPAVPFELSQDIPSRDDVMMLDAMDQADASLTDNGGHLPYDEITPFPPEFPMEANFNASYENSMATLDAPAFQCTPHVDFTPAAITQSCLLSPEIRNPGLGEVTMQEAPVFQSAPETSDISRNESRMNSMALPTQFRYATAEDWERNRALFTSLYRDQNMTLKDVKAIMREKYGFNATDKMYKKRINDWQLHKNRKASEKEEISRIMEANQKQGVDLGEPMVNGRMVKMHLIERHRKEKRKAGSPSPPSSNHDTMAPNGGRSTKRARRPGPTCSVSISFSRIGDPTDFRHFENILFQVDQYYSSKLGNDPHGAWHSWKASSKRRQIKVSYTFQGDTYTSIFDGINSVFNRYYLANKYLQENRSRDAWRLAHEGAEMVRPLLQQESPSFLRELLLHFVGIYSGDYAGIQRQLLHLLTSMSFITYGRGHPVSIICRLLQILYGKQHIVEQTMKKLHDTFKHHLGEDHSASLFVQNRICTALMSQKRYAEAERSLQDIIGASERCYGRSARGTRLTLIGLAHLYYLQKRYTEAREIIKDVLQRGKGVGERDEVDICGKRLQGSICMAQRDYGAAKAYFCSALWGSLLLYGLKDPLTSHKWTLYQYAKEKLQKRQGVSKSPTQCPQEVWDISEEPLRCPSRPRSSSLPSGSVPGKGCKAGFWCEAAI